MFRCYFVENGRISWGNDLETSTLAEAIELAQNLRQAALKSDKSPANRDLAGGVTAFPRRP